MYYIKRITTRDNVNVQSHDKEESKCMWHYYGECMRHLELVNILVYHNLPENKLSLRTAP